MVLVFSTYGTKIRMKGGENMTKIKCPSRKKTSSRTKVCKLDKTCKFKTRLSALGRWCLFIVKFVFAVATIAETIDKLMIIIFPCYFSLFMRIYKYEYGFTSNYRRTSLAP